ncbi:hypothetical protein [Leptothoe sp. PORK10 BA2]|uniref:hypothetical protein n=1 Tax=Leptothoe sp. PORK10 BA2 TaxID=3110254 RepID=UPI002B1F4917|nr:hypothetical protein [Leptothoe sp. PORK10 BA2]MEA5464165.1 hypothetical protein [Leptothoe sp. PORK10 BA2]
MKLNAFIHTETYSVQSIGPCLLELERETGYAHKILVKHNTQQMLRKILKGLLVAMRQQLTQSPNASAIQL